MDESNGTCSSFEAQKWRKTKCKHCFKDIEQHSKVTQDGDNGHSKLDNEIVQETSLGDLCFSNEQSPVDFEEDLNREVCLMFIITFKKSSSASHDKIFADWYSVKVELKLSSDYCLIFWRLNSWTSRLYAVEFIWFFCFMKMTICDLLYTFLCKNLDSLV